MNEISFASWTQWGLGILIMLGGVFLRLVHGRLSEVSKENREDRDRIWVTQTAHRRDFDAFRDRVFSDMASKTDIREMEMRLMSAIKSQDR